MKSLLLLSAAVLMSIAAFPSVGQVSANSNTQSSASTQAQAGATNAGNAQNINFMSDVPGSTTTTLHSAPALGGQSYYGSFSPDSCVTAGGGGVSFLPGIAGNLAVPIKDEECSLRRNVQTSMQMSVSLRSHGNAAAANALEAAAINIMCQVNDATRKAYVAAGLCTGEFARDPKEQQAADRQRQRQIDSVYSPG